MVIVKVGIFSVRYHDSVNFHIEQNSKDVQNSFTSGYDQNRRQGLLNTPHLPIYTVVLSLPSSEWASAAPVEEYPGGRLGGVTGYFVL